jgi:hypothetical protein
MNDDRLPKRILCTEFMKPNSWSSDLCKIFEGIGMSEYFIQRKQIDIKTFIMLKHQKDIDEWQIKRRTLPKLRTYNLFKSEYGTENYLKCTFNRGKKAVVSQFRCGVLPLKVETGRYLNIPLHFRICELCNDNEVEDEFHFLTRCALYSLKRTILYSKAVGLYVNFLSYENDVKMLILMNDEYLTKNVVDYLYKTFMKRKTYIFQTV